MRLHRWSHGANDIVPSAPASSGEVLAKRFQPRLLHQATETLGETVADIVDRLTRGCLRWCCLYDSSRAALELMPCLIGKARRVAEQISAPLAPGREGRVQCGTLGGSLRGSLGGGFHLRGTGRRRLRCRSLRHLCRLLRLLRSGTCVRRFRDGGARAGACRTSSSLTGNSLSTRQWALDVRPRRKALRLTRLAL